jgi:hypothetical protein
MKRKPPSTIMKLNVKSKKKKKQVYKFKIGDHVRVSHQKRTFGKGYQEKWTIEYFKIAKRVRRGKQDVCKISDINLMGSRFRVSSTGTNYRKSINLKIWVITKLSNSEQSYKGKVKTHKYINRQNQSTTGKL